VVASKSKALAMAFWVMAKASRGDCVHLKAAVFLTIRACVCF
jgi:hypothetical protein